MLKKLKNINNALVNYKRSIMKDIKSTNLY